MSATTLSDHDTTALLHGFQDNKDGDPVALLKVFQAGGFKLHDNLVDNLILVDPAYQAGVFQFNTPFAPKGFTLGYDPSQFVGPLMLWMVIKMRAGYATTQNLNQAFEVLKYLIAQGAKCSVTLSYLTYNSKYLTGTNPFTRVLSVDQELQGVSAETIERGACSQLRAFPFASPIPAGVRLLLALGGHLFDRLRPVAVPQA